MKRLSIVICGLLILTYQPLWAQTYTVPADLSSNLSDIQSFFCNPSDATDNSKTLCNNALEAVEKLLAQPESSGKLATCYCNEGSCPIDGYNEVTVLNPDTPSCVDVFIFEDIIGEILNLPDLLLGDSDVCDAPNGVTDSDLPTENTVFAYTDCSGWITYLLTASGFRDAYNEVEDSIPESVKDDYGTYAKASNYHNFFASIAPAGNSTSSNWSGFNDMGSLQAGDILAYCISSVPSKNNSAGTRYNYCDAENPPEGLKGDSGHIMLVLDSTLMTDTEIKTLFPSQARNLTADNASVYKVSVVDSSSAAHDHNTFASDSSDDTVAVNDSRQRYGNLDTNASSPSCKSQNNGGLGTGVLYVLQIENSSSDTPYIYSKVFTRAGKFVTPKDPNSDIPASNTGEFYGFAFGRLQ